MNVFLDRHVNIHNWPGQSSLALGILEDPLTQVFELQSSQQRTHSQVATQVLSKKSMRGNLLRRPFDALSDIEIELDQNFASRLLQKNTITLEQSSLCRKYKQKTFSRGHGESFLPLTLDTDELFFIEIALLEKPSASYEFPKTIGSALGQRWKSRPSKSDSQTLVASGSCENRPFMFVQVVKNDTSKLELRMAAKSSDDKSSDSDVESVPDRDSYQNPFERHDVESSDSESVTESVAHSIVKKLDSAYEGTSNLSDLRATLQQPQLIKRYCREKENSVSEAPLGLPSIVSIEADKITTTDTVNNSAPTD